MTGHNARRRAHSHRGRRIARQQGARFRRRHDYQTMRLRLVKLDVQMYPNETGYTGFWNFVRSTFEPAE